MCHSLQQANRLGSYLVSVHTMTSSVSTLMDLCNTKAMMMIMITVGLHNYQYTLLLPCFLHFLPMASTNACLLSFSNLHNSTTPNSKFNVGASHYFHLCWQRSL
jgi:hypothetical protein